MRAIITDGGNFFLEGKSQVGRKAASSVSRVISPEGLNIPLKLVQNNKCIYTALDKMFVFIQNI